MPAQLVILPVVLPLLAAVVNLLAHTPRNVQRGVNILALSLNVAACFWMVGTIFQGPDAPALVLASQMGNWPAPFGVSVVADLFSAVLLATTGVVALTVYIFVLAQTPLRFSSGYFHAMYPLLICGVNWAFLTGDLFNLFVSFEVMLLASYSLMVIGTTPRQMRQAYKYVLINLVASLVFVAACGWVYGALGTLNFAELTLMAHEGKVGGRAALAVGALLVIFATKSAAFPLWFWLPDTYPTMPPALAGLYAGLLTKVGVYVLVRVFVMCFHQAEPVADALTPLMLLSAGVTMFGGVLGAVASRTMRQILSTHIVSQIGYMILGVGLAAGFAVSDDLAIPATAAVLLFVIHNMVVKSSLFLCCGMVEKYAGTDDLDKFGSILRRDLPLATLFLVAALSLVGLPPLSGFFGKFLLIKGSFDRADAAGYVLGVVATVTGMLTLLSMTKIWSYGFWSDTPPGTLSARRPADFRPPYRGVALAAIGILVVSSLTMGLGAGWYYGMATAAARDVVRPEAYVRAVLGDNAADVFVNTPAYGITATPVTEVTP